MMTLEEEDSLPQKMKEKEPATKKRKGEEVKSDVIEIEFGSYLNEFTPRWKNGAMILSLISTFDAKLKEEKATGFKRNITQNNNLVQYYYMENTFAKIFNLDAGFEENIRNSSGSWLEAGGQFFLSAFDEGLFTSSTDFPPPVPAGSKIAGRGQQAHAFASIFIGGRTKTCIIATVSPAVNQRMMKSTLIKDLYGEIERLKADVYAAREKNGVYIPRERYFKEESERKAMADQNEQMGMTIENHQKELQAKYDYQVQQSFDLGKQLDATQNNLNLTSKLLAKTENDLQRCRC
ncbi:hypothetical protein OROMI_014564 [Orobanche minor]